ncbi:MAG: hypothetical protein ABSG56_29040 [Bryobacteraceae bacterium]|jgi:hypothetical protein
MSRILRVFGTLALLGMLAASMGPANAAQIQLNTGAPYLCAVVEGGNTAAGTPVIAYSCSGGPEDQWEFVNGQFQGIGTANGVCHVPRRKGGRGYPRNPGGPVALQRRVKPAVVYQ